jgi:acetoin utilization deacetylase AcuC-like enzyme
VNLYYSPEYTSSAHSFETTRKAAWVADSLLADPIAGVELVTPQPLTWEQVARVHDPRYVHAVQTGSPAYLAESQGFNWDPALWPMVSSSNGGAVAAALNALERGVAGSLSSGLHHARRETGVGYCTFNGLVIAAREALAAGASSVLILDFDAHCGGGTASLIAEDEHVWQVDVAVNSFDYYPDALRDRSRGRLWFSLVHRSDDYLTEIARGLDEAARRRPPRPDGPGYDLCLYNAGMDPHQSSAGGLTGITTDVLASREQMVFEWARIQGIPIAFVLAGGYLGRGLDRAGLVALHRLTIAAAATLPLASR